MSMRAGSGAVPATRDDLRGVEVRLDSRLQEVAARLVLHDGRFAAMGDRVNQADRRNDALSARVESRHKAFDRRFDAVDYQIEQAKGELRDEMRRLSRELDSCRHLLSRLTTALVAVGWVIVIAGLAAAIW